MVLLVSSNPNTRTSFWIALTLLVVTVVLMLTISYDMLELHFYIGPFYAHHWLSWIGTTVIALYVPIYHMLKKAKPQQFMALLNSHIFINLLSFMGISIHFTNQITRPAQFYPDLGTGVVLYASMLLLITTGFCSKFGALKSRTRSLRFIHLSVTVTFYLIILIHILHGLNLI
jgi:hypothetical protein